MTGRNWTNKDEELLIAKWKSNTIRQLANMFDVSTKSIRSKARSLRGQGHYLPYKTQRWLQFDDEELMRLRKTRSDTEIAKTLNRTLGSVRGRAKKLRKRGFDIAPSIRNTEHPRAGFPWTEEDTTYFLAHINANGIESVSKALKRTPLAIAHRVRTHQAQHHMDPAIVEHAEAILEPFNKDDEDKGDDGE